MGSPVLSVRGSKHDYVLKTIATDSGPLAVLVGVNGDAAGELHPLEGARVVQFADGRLPLESTALASQLKSNHQGTSVGGTSSSSARLERADSHRLGQEETDHGGGASKLQAGKSGPIEVGSRASPARHEEGTASVLQEISSNSEPPRSASKTSLRENSLGNSSSEWGQNRWDSAESNSERESGSMSQAAFIPQVSGQFTGAASASDHYSGIGTGKTISPVVKRTLSEGLRPDEAAPGPTPENSTGGLAISPPPGVFLQGTFGGDSLSGSEGNDQIDGLRNSELGVDGAFQEELYGLDGDDFIQYRGFFGAKENASVIQADLQGGLGNDVIQVVLDGVSSTLVDGGEGQDTLTLSLSGDPFDPWAPEALSWGWTFESGEVTFKADYKSQAHPGASIREASATIESIGTNNGSALRLVRPTHESSTSLSGGDESDLIVGTAMTKHITAGAGNDVVIAQAGTTVELGGGINKVYSESPDITLSYKNAEHPIEIDLASKLGMSLDKDSNLISVDRLMTNVNHVIGSAGADVIQGNESDNTLRTGGGADSLWGRGGADQFIVDISNGDSMVRIGDFSVDDGDTLFINLRNWMDASSDRSYSSLEFKSDADASLWQASLSTEEGAVLSVLMSMETNSIQFWNDGAYQPIVQFDSDISAWSINDWQHALHIDYL